MKRLAPGLIPLLALTVAGVVLAGHRQKAGSETFTPTAGVETGTSVDLLTNAEYYGVQALKLWDFDRRTCQLQIEQGSMNASGTTVLDAARICEPKLSESWKRAHVGDSHFVTGIAVCTSQAKDPAVHGVELWAAAVSAGGKFAPAKSSVKIEFAGCEKWSVKRACPTGTIATGVRAFSDGSAGVVGLALRCHRVETLP